MQTAGRIDDHHVGIVRLCRIKRIESNRSRIGSHLLLDDWHAYALTPDHQLFHSGRPKRVGRTQIDLLSPLFKLICQLADRRSLSDSIDTNHHDDIRFLAFGNKEIFHIFRFILREQSSDFLA